LARTAGEKKEEKREISVMIVSAFEVGVQESLKKWTEIGDREWPGPLPAPPRQRRGRN